LLNCIKNVKFYCFLCIKCIEIIESYGIIVISIQGNLKEKELGNMNYIISGKNIDVTEGLKNAVYDKLSKLEKYFAEDAVAQVTFSVEKDRQKIEVTIPMKGHIIRAEQVSDDMYVSIDLVLEVIERQVNRHKKKLIDKEQNAAYLQHSFVEEDTEDDDEVKIVRNKRFAVKPMYPEDACIQMDLLGHNFYVFRNAETEEVNVVYKRKGNTYGLIEPEF
jgi:ribosomal subunit interface protein